MRAAFYPGSFDPPTLGHLDIMRRTLQLFDKLIVGVGVHPGKSPLFSAVERVGLLQEDVKLLPNSPHVDVIPFGNLTIDAARQHGACAIVRGVRDGIDLSYEMQMAGMNRAMDQDLVTIFLMASPEVSHITSTLVRQIAKLGGNVSSFVSPHTSTVLQQKQKLSESLIPAVMPS